MASKSTADWLAEARESWEQGHKIIVRWVKRWFDKAEQPPLAPTLGRETDLGLTACHDRLLNALKVLAKRIDSLHDAKRAAPWMLNPPLLFTHSETASADARLRIGLRTLARSHNAATIKANRTRVLAEIEAHADAQRQWFGELAEEIKPTRPARKRRWSKSDAEPIIRALLLHAQKDGRTFSTREIQAETGIPKTTVERTDAWKQMGRDTRRHVTTKTEWAENEAVTDCHDDD